MTNVFVDFVADHLFYCKVTKCNIIILVCANHHRLYPSTANH